MFILLFKFNFNFFINLNLMLTPQQLKYIENHSVEKVSEILEISSDDVMDVLVYIVDLVRNL